ncbi:hypothetical protein ACP4OV_019650 [Aristida adscensionis]
MDKSNQNTVYCDPQRDVSVSGATQSAPISDDAHVVQSANCYAPNSTSVQQGYNAAQYPNYYYDYQQTPNDYSFQHVDQSSGAAYQTPTSFQNSGSYIGPSSNTYYNAGAHQTPPGYAMGSYYCHQSNGWVDGSSTNNYAQSYHSYTPSDSNAAQSSSSLPSNSIHYQ